MAHSYLCHGVLKEFPDSISQDLEVVSTPPSNGYFSNLRFFLDYLTSKKGHTTTQTCHSLQYGITHKMATSRGRKAATKSTPC